MSTTLKFLPVQRQHGGRRSHDNALGVSPSSAAKKLGISRRIIRKAIECGDIKTVEFAGARYIPHSEIERIKQMFSLP